MVADLTLKLVLESPLGVRYNASPFWSILSIIASYVRFFIANLLLTNGSNALLGL